MGIQQKRQRFYAYYFLDGKQRQVPGGYSSRKAAETALEKKLEEIARGSRTAPVLSESASDILKAAWR